MFSHEVQVRVRYADTDKMGIVYYGNYAKFFEIARVEALRHLGISYKELEQEGVMMPVVAYYSKYKNPAKYDDLLTIKTYVKNIPSVKIHFDYKVYNEENLLLNEAYTTLVFIHLETNKLMRIPKNLKILVEKCF